MIRVDRMGSFLLIFLLLLFQLAAFLTFSGLKGVNSVGANFKDTLAANQPTDSLEEAKKVWQISDTYIYRLIGYDSLTRNLVALGESPNGFFFFSQSSPEPLWACVKATENYYIWEEAVGFVPYINGQIAILTHLDNQFRLLDLNRGEPLTPFFLADNSHSSVYTYVDEGTEELRILATYNGTARLLDEQMTVLWSVTLVEEERQSITIVIDADFSSSRALVYYGHIVCLDLADGTILWYKDNLFPVLDMQHENQVISDFNKDGVSDILCALYGNDTNRLVLLDGLTGSVLWQLTTSEYSPTILSAVDINQDGTKDLVIKEKNQTYPSESVVTALSISPELIFWQININEAFTGDSFQFYDFYVDEFYSTKAGLEVLISQWNNTIVEYQYDPYNLIWERSLSLRLVTGDSFTLLWNITLTAGPDINDNLPSWYYSPQPDLNGDGRADFIFNDGESGYLVHDGESTTPFSLIPDLEQEWWGRISRDPDDLPVLFCTPKIIGVARYFYSFSGIEVPKDKQEGSHGIGNNIPFLWELIACTLFVGLFKYRRIKRRSM